VARFVTYRGRVSCRSASHHGRMDHHAQEFYLCLRRSTYTDAVSTATTAIINTLNFGTGMLDCSRYTFCPCAFKPGET